MFDYLVVGKGLIGSAAARYLFKQTENIAVVGPDEPANWAKHQGVFASHYDQGRITRVLDQSMVWATLAQASIAQYSKLERGSGIRFHHKVGCLNVGVPGEDTRSGKTLKVAKDLGATFDHLNAAKANERLPFLQFPSGRELLFERGNAGYINPRSLLAAQLSHLPADAIFTDEVKAITTKSDYVEVTLASGQQYQSQKVLLTAGAYSNFLLEDKLAFTIKPRTIVLARVANKEQARLNEMPSIIFYEGLASTALSGVYILPPISYPDGHSYVKIGGRMNELTPLETKRDFLDWFHSSGSREEAKHLKDTLFFVIPNLEADAIITKPCVYTGTAHEHPYIDELIKNRLYVAAGGNGASAKSSNELGRLAADMVLGKKPDSVFQAVYA